MLRYAVVAVIVIAAVGAVRASETTNAAKPKLYTAQQAAGGERTYDAKCSACHGDHLEGGAGPALSGTTLGTLAKNTKMTVGDMFSFVAQQMPLNDPASLSRSEYAEIMAYILKKNGYPAGTKSLTYGAAMVSTVRITSAYK
jgi:mono/diheme cytochrome c family protein